MDRHEDGVRQNLPVVNQQMSTPDQVAYLLTALLQRLASAASCVR